MAISRLVKYKPTGGREIDTAAVIAPPRPARQHLNPPEMKVLLARILQRADLEFQQPGRKSRVRFSGLEGASWRQKKAVKEGKGEICRMKRKGGGGREANRLCRGRRKKGRRKKGKRKKGEKEKTKMEGRQMQQRGR